MLGYQSSEVVEAIHSAPNVNSALKNFLRNEIQKGDPAAKFVKKLRTLASAKSSEALQSFIDQSLPKFEKHLFVIARYAHGNAVAEISSAIVENFAEDFNATFEKKGDGVEVLNKEKFSEIVSQVVKNIESRLEQGSLPQGGFMKSLMLDWIFEPEVLPEVLSVVSDSQ